MMIGFCKIMCPLKFQLAEQLPSAGWNEALERQNLARHLWSFQLKFNFISNYNSISNVL